MKEVISLRTENAKVFDIGADQRRAEICIGAVHYKDDYADAHEQFKDIDLTWVDNKITKAPYTLERIGNKIIVTDKKTGNTSSIEMDSIGEVKLSAQKSLIGAKTTEIVKDVDIEIIPSPDSVRYQTIIKSESALVDLKYKISGDIPILYSAVDDDGDAVPLVMSESNGILTESVDSKSFVSERSEKTAIKYPIKIDPIIQIQGSGQDSFCYEFSQTTNYGSSGYFMVNSRSDTGQRGFSFIDIPITGLPSGAVIVSATFSAYYYYYDIASYPPSGYDCVLNPLRRSDWVESELTWNIYKTGSNWGTAGALNTSTDYDTSLSASAAFPSGVNAWMNFDVKSIVEAAISGSINFNVRALINSGSGYPTFPQFYSKEYATDTKLRPRLTIIFNNVTGGSSATMEKKGRHPNHLGFLGNNRIMLNGIQPFNIGQSFENRNTAVKAMMTDWFFGAPPAPPAGGKIPYHLFFGGIH